MSTNVAAPLLPSFLRPVVSWARNRQIYATRIDGDYHLWDVDSLQRYAQDMFTVQDVALCNLNPSLATWFPNGTHVPLSDMQDHLQRIGSVDLSVPLLIAPGMRLIDGCHRYLRALVDDKPTLPARYLLSMPAPDCISYTGQ